MNTIKFIYLFLITLILSVLTGRALAQTPFTAYSPEIGTTVCPSSNVGFNAGVFQDLPLGITFSGLARSVVACTAASTHYRSSNYTSTSKNDAISENRYVAWTFTADASVEFTLSEISIRHESTAQGANNGAIYYSVNGAPFQQVGGDFTIAETNGRNVLTFASPISIPSGQGVEFRWFCWRTGAPTGTGNVRYKGGSDYATGTGIVGTFTPTVSPAANANATFTPFFYALNEGPSSSQALTVNGLNLNNSIVVSASIILFVLNISYQLVNDCFSEHTLLACYILENQHNLIIN